MLARPGAPRTAPGVAAALTPWSAALFASLPPFIRAQLVLERESAGSVQLSQIETERLLAGLVGRELGQRKQAGRYAGTFAPVCHFFGYQARGSLPSRFDCDYAYALGRTAAALACPPGSGAAGGAKGAGDGGGTGLLATVRNLHAPVADWRCAGVPLTNLLAVDREEHGRVTRARVPPAPVDVYRGGSAARRVRTDRRAPHGHAGHRGRGPGRGGGRAGCRRAHRPRARGRAAARGGRRRCRAGCSSCSPRTRRRAPSVPRVAARM